PEAPLSLGGVAIAGLGAVILLQGGSAPSSVLAPGAVAGALLLIAGPWLWRLALERDAERSARIRTEERADVATRVHDSVLQTLALIQRHADEPRRVASLARRQERELRGWLYADQPVGDDTSSLLAALSAVAADHGLFLSGVRAELGDAVEVVGEAGTVADAIRLIRELDPDVVLLDVHLPDGSGDVIINAVAPERPGVKFLALSVSDAAEDVIAVIRAGARGYVTKTIAADELAAAIERVAQGDAVFSPRLAGFVLDAFRAGEEIAGDAELNELTTREREVLQLIARGYMYKEIAARLHI